MWYSLTYAISASREDKRHNEDQGIRRKRKCEETMMSEEKETMP